MSSPFSDNTRPVLSVVVPVYNEEENIEAFVEAVTSALSNLAVSYEVILIEDGSRDRTWPLIKEASVKDGHIKGLSLSRNFGPQNATFAGICLSSGKAIITMDGDLQHPPEKIADLFQAWQQGYKIVETKRLDSQDFSFLKRFSSSMFNRVFSMLSDLPMTEGTSDFRLIDEQVVESIKEMRDVNLFLRGITHWVGFPTTTITYQAEERHSGTTKFNPLRLVRYSTGALLSFSLKPLKIGIWIGLITSFLASAELIYIFVRFFQGATVPGWASTLAIISFMFGILFVLIGIIGAYIGNIFEMSKNRPRFIINEMSGFSDGQ